MKVIIDLPDTLHPRAASLVRRFAEAMGKKLDKSQRKYGYTDDWTESSLIGLQDALIEHVEKGDPIDVANFCAFLWHRKARTQ